MKKLALIGTSWPFRGGGIASFNERLAREFQTQGYQVTIYTFSLQYPSFLFPGKTQYSEQPAPADLHIEVCINSMNPLNWISVGRKIRDAKPDLVLVRYWLPLMGPCLGTILRIIKGNKHSKLICIADNIIPHEKRPGDKPFTQYFIAPMDGFVTMSAKVLADLKQFTQTRAVQAVHPLYDNFGDPLDKTIAKKHLGIPVEQPIILFFGFIRKYKGLDLLLDAMALLKEQAKSDASMVIPKLLVAGEFYDAEAGYQTQIDQLGIRDLLILKTDFIADDQVRYYLSAADFVIQPYKNATQSGVTPLAYHFEKPMLVTNVGGLADMVPDGKVGLVVEPAALAIAEAVKKLYALGENHFLPQLRAEKIKYGWPQLVQTIEALAQTPRS
ncbi:MAG: glycosyl transferase family 1 [Bacteroidetes bacterium 24-39-8]|jgi:glycosyltransferase involved in cell wall biosynthesis|nr:MAG: glycosyl transferase family 1 [Sphingobacteriia bacterium 35-40-8]OYZ47870.1 MAG: glycosyl transferase family 1 [Bacteroidetes bacterium 24-39-8]OZA69427.1 MAG: glycosyl transferase family 1 [Sphingobacteriia bacterium 39-39-8]HQR93228.1 glycosyltransferase [Sediminibacterium sp.]HQS56362.1 glycosyltransferase [Sediminibacterium sp.]